MKFLIIFALALATAVAVKLPKNELKSRSIVVPAGRPAGRISNGRTAGLGQFPYQVGLSLQDQNGQYSWCGGSLLNNKQVLTAAHCADGTVRARVYLGATNRYYPQVQHEVTSENFIIHPGWNSDTLQNDIAIINIPYTGYNSIIQPVKLPSAGSSYSSFNGDEVVASGWGRISDYSTNVATNLQFAHMSVLPSHICRSFFGSVITNSNMCISTYGGVSTCNGDSGGPLVLESTKFQIGLTSFGAKDGCQKGFPAVFTRLTSFLDWIKHNSSS